MCPPWYDGPPFASEAHRVVPACFAIVRSCGHRTAPKSPRSPEWGLRDEERKDFVVPLQQCGGRKGVRLREEAKVGCPVGVLKTRRRKGSQRAPHGLEPLRA